MARLSKSELSYFTELQSLYGDKYKSIYFTALDYKHPKVVNGSCPLVEQKVKFYTPNRFTCQNNRREDNLSDIGVLALDIDYKKSKSVNTSLEPLDAFYGLVEGYIGSILPPPSYIEYGNQLRCIYILREPVRLYKGKRVSWINLCKRLASEWSKCLNLEIDICCEAQKPASFYRMPGRKNEKSGDTIHIKAYSSERYTVQELIDEYLPDYKPKRHVVLSRKGNVTVFHNERTLWLNRLAELSKVKDKVMHRYPLLWIYACGCQWLYGDNALEEVLSFNGTLKHPYPVKSLTSKLSSQFREDKRYKFRNGTINEYLGIEVFTMTKREKDKLEKIAAGTTRKQLAEKNYQTVVELYRMGIKRQEIAERTGLSLDRVRQLITKYRKEQK